MPARARQDITPGRDARGTRAQTTRLRGPALWMRSDPPWRCGGAADPCQVLRQRSGTMCGFLQGGLPLPDSSPFGDRLTNRPASRQRAARNVCPNWIHPPGSAEGLRSYVGY